MGAPGRASGRRWCNAGESDAVSVGDARFVRVSLRIALAEYRLMRLPVKIGRIGAGFSRRWRGGLAAPWCDRAVFSRSAGLPSRRGAEWWAFATWVWSRHAG